MNARVTGKNATEGNRYYKWVAEASELGIRPGEVPGMLETHLGNGQPFVFHSIDGDGAMIYRQSLGCLTLAVLND